MVLGLVIFQGGPSLVTKFFAICMGARKFYLGLIKLEMLTRIQKALPINRKLPLPLRDDFKKKKLQYLGTCPNRGGGGQGQIPTSNFFKVGTSERGEGGVRVISHVPNPKN